MAIAGGFGMPSATDANARYNTGRAPAGYSQNYGTGSNPGDMYNRRVQSQYLYGDPYGPVSGSGSYLIDQYKTIAAQNAQNQAAMNQFGQSVLGFNDAWNQRQQGFLTDNYRLSQEAANWQRSNNAADLGDANQNLAFRDQIIGNLQQMFGINDRALANQIAQSLLDQSVREANLRTNLNQNTLDRDKQLYQNRSSAIASGTMFAPGTRASADNINTAAQYAADILNQNLRGVTEGGDLTRQGYNIGAEKERLGLQNEILGQQRGRVGDLGSIRNIQSQGQQNELESRTAQNKYQEQLARLRYQRVAEQFPYIKDMLASGDATTRQMAENLMKSLSGVS